MVTPAAMATGTIISTIPVVVTGGILMKFTEVMLPMQKAAIGRQPSRRSKRKDVYGRGYSGTFSNVGF